MIIPLIVAIAMFMDMLDTTIVGVAIPTIAHAFSINPVDLKLALTSYLITLAVFIPLSGYAADRFGAKKTFSLAIIIFSLGSLLCGLSTNLPLLIICRIIQGIGGSLMMPVGRLLILRNYYKAEYIKAMNIVIIPSLLAPALGPTIGGFILHYFNWTTIFWINVPIGFIGLLAVWHFLPQDTHKEKSHPLDLKGFILFGLGISTLTFSMAVLGDDFTHLNWAILWFFISIIFLGGYYFHYRQTKTPVVDLSLFNNNIFSLSLMISFFSRCATGAIIFLLPLLLQLVWNDTPLQSGLMFFPYAMGMLCSKLIFIHQWLQRYGFRKVLWWNGLGIAASLFLLSIGSKPGSHIILGACLFLQGALVSQQYTLLGVLTYLELDNEKYSQATSIVGTHMQFSTGVGIAFSAILLHLLSGYFDVPLFSFPVFHSTLLILGMIMLITLPFVSRLSPTLFLPKNKTKNS
jgi:EmrB/QacA subfamily drug resistance transporter